MRELEAKSIYRKLAQTYVKLPLFFQPWYLDAVSQEGMWDVAISKDGDQNIRGVLPYFVKKKYGISYLTMPHLTPYLGPFFIYPKEQLKNTSRYHFEKKVGLELAAQIPKDILQKIHCHPDCENVLPFIWSGFDATVRYTYVLNGNNKDALWTGLDSKQRNAIKGATDKIRIKSCNDVEQFYALNEKSFLRSSQNIPYGFAFFQKLDNALVERKSRMIFQAVDRSDRVHAAVYMVFDDNTAYCLCVGSEPEFKNSGAIPHLIWEAILQSFERVNQFNFEGGMIPNIEQFFRSFGGRLTPYYKLQRTRNTFTQAIFYLLNKI